MTEQPTTEFQYYRALLAFEEKCKGLSPEQKRYFLESLVGIQPERPEYEASIDPSKPGSARYLETENLHPATPICEMAIDSSESGKHKVALVVLPEVLKQQTTQYSIDHTVAGEPWNHEIPIPPRIMEAMPKWGPLVDKLLPMNVVDYLRTRLGEVEGFKVLQGPEMVWLDTVLRSYSENAIYMVDNDPQQLAPKQNVEVALYQGGHIENLPAFLERRAKGFVVEMTLNDAQLNTLVNGPADRELGSALGLAFESILPPSIRERAQEHIRLYAPQIGSGLEVQDVATTPKTPPEATVEARRLGFLEKVFGAANRFGLGG